MRRFFSALLAWLLTIAPVYADTLFPNSPTTGQTYPYGSLTYQYDGAKWVSIPSGSPAITKQVFTASGTYTPSSGMQYAIIECVGSGAGGGGAAQSTAQTNGGGGGGGSYSRVYVTAAQVGASQTVTVGNNGTGGTAGSNNGTDGSDVSVGTLCVGKGGTHGNGATANSVATGGAGGVAGTGDVTVPGQNGFNGMGGSITTLSLYSGTGGSSGLGFGAGGKGQGSGTGTNASLYGGGGSGGGSFNNSAAAAGGDGAKGIVVITEYLASSWGGPLPQVVLPGGRLTTASATPVPTTDQTSITTIYYTPYKGTFTPLWNGTQFTPVYTAELSAAMGSNWSANSNYDWFEYNDAGTLRLCSGPAWTSDTARGTGAGTTQLTLVQGIYTNTVSMTCRYSNSATVTVAAGYGTYLGTMRTTGSTGTTQIKFGSLALNGGEAWNGIWNMYNRVSFFGMVRDTTDSWTYGTASWRATNNSSTERFSFVVGQAEDVFEATYYNTVSRGVGINGWVGIGYDSTTVRSGINIGDNTASTLTEPAIGKFATVPAIGFHFMSGIEYSNGGTSTFAGDVGTTFVQTGLTFTGWY